MVETYYELLGVSEDATTDEIERAYREKLKKTHPDVSDAEDAGDRTKQLIEAKEVLADEDERARYDRVGHEQYVDGEVSSGDRGPTSEATTSETDGDSTRQETGGSARQRQPGASTGTGWSEATQEAWDFDSGSTDSSTASDEQRAPRDSWRDADQQSSTDGSDEAGSWRAWDTDGAYSVRNDNSFQRNRVFPTSQSLVLLSMSFFAYPLMAGVALFSPFPLFVRLTVGACVLLLIGYLQSIPEVGMVVFGGWSVLVPFVFAAIGLPLFSPIGFVAMAATFLPFGLSALVRWAIRP